jgi:phage host-nuclease inhibitor protein Gam
MSEVEFESKKEMSGFAADFLEDLENYVDNAEILALNIVDPEQFKIVSREQANYFVKKLKESQNEMSKVNNTADYSISETTTRVNEWREIELRKRQRDIDYISTLLETFAIEELANSNGKTKSISLPFGSIGFRKQQPKYEYEDAALLKSLEDNKLESYITRKPVTNKAELKKQATVKEGKLYINGIELEGVTVTAIDDKFEIK